MEYDLILIVAHTWPDDKKGSPPRIGRIINARKAERHERTAYEEGHVRTDR